MSSREIAELVEKRHDKVKQSIERLAGRGVIDLPPLGEYLDSLGRTATEYRIGKRDSYVVVAQLSPEFTARLVDRWQELEAAAPPPVPAGLPNFTNPALAARAWADEREARDVAEAEVYRLAPKAAFHDAVASSVNARPVAVIAKEIGTGEKRMFAWLRCAGFLMANNLPYQDKLDQELFVVEPGTWTDAHGGEHAYSRVLVTGKGLIRIQAAFSEECAIRALRDERETRRKLIEGLSIQDRLRVSASNAERAAERIRQRLDQVQS
jgi:phage antirepressor YoqD-like protein